MMEVGVTALSGENISINGVLELLKPMSAIAGRRAVNLGQYYLENNTAAKEFYYQESTGLRLELLSF